MLAREVLRLRGTIPSRDAEWDVMVDLYFYRDPEAEEQKAAEGEAEKIPGAEDAVAEGGFAAAAGDWDAAVPGTFVPPENTGPGTSWDADASGVEWAADPAATESAPVATGW
jgi:small subunit ribosomal protein SAe